MPTVLRAGPSHDSVADSMEDMMRTHKTQVTIQAIINLWSHCLTIFLPALRR